MTTYRIPNLWGVRIIHETQQVRVGKMDYEAPQECVFYVGESEEEVWKTICTRMDAEELSHFYTHRLWYGIWSDVLTKNDDGTGFSYKRVSHMLTEVLPEWTDDMSALPPILLRLDIFPVYAQV